MILPAIINNMLPSIGGIPPNMEPMIAIAI